jgi:hypothetical protein
LQQCMRFGRRERRLILYAGFSMFKLLAGLGLDPDRGYSNGIGTLIQAMVLEGTSGMR